MYLYTTFRYIFIIHILFVKESMDIEVKTGHIVIDEKELHLPVEFKISLDIIVVICRF
ncbi:hypothetical protein JOE44_001311 [Chryseobacterium sp. PvR013]|nr:hypothetical protein [Chryseobacterium sp. PvR013]